MTEIVVNITTISVLYKQILITLWHRMNLRYVRQDKDVIADAFTLFNL